MSPFKSSLARSVGKLLGVYKETDLSLRGATQESRKPPGFSATGGIIITSGSDVFHVFIGNSEQSFSGTLDNTCEILCVAGGGSGGYFYGRGGGAGGIVHSPNFPLEGGVTYKVSSGDGGDGRASSVGFGNQGSDSYFKPSPASAAPSFTNDSRAKMLKRLRRRGTGSPLPPRGLSRGDCGRVACNNDDVKNEEEA